MKRVRADIINPIRKWLKRFHKKPPKKIFNLLSRDITELFQNIVMTENLFIIVLAIIIGTLGGFGAVGVRALIREISAVFYPGGGTLLENMAATPWYLKVMLPAVGGLIVGPIIYKYAPEAKGTGVPEVMQAVLVKGGNIRPRVAIFKSLLSSITIGSGGSVGREGPIIQIGSSLGSLVGQFFHISSKRMKTLVGCGAAAGIAAAFNAPVAGALFAVEIILMDYAIAQFSPIVISSVMATVISHAFEGDFPAIEVVGNHALHSFWEPGFYIVFGLAAGVVSFLFIKVLYSFNDVWEKKIKTKSYIKPMFGGLVVGAIALVFPQIMGVGYDSVNLVINSEDMTYLGLGGDFINQLLGSHVFWIMALLLVFVKIFATSMTLGSGGSGGIFAPSLFIGAMLGAFFGHFTHYYFPDITASAGTYALIGMGAVVAGTTRAPITAIFTIFELTKETSIILPLMLTSIISTIVCSKFSAESIYTLKLILRNINVRGRAEFDIMKNLYVKDLFTRDFVSIPQKTDFNEAVMKLISKGLPFLSVHNVKTGAFVGVVSVSTIKDMMFMKETLRLVCIAGDIADESVRPVNLDDNCDAVLKRMQKLKIDGLPVVDAKANGRQIGVIWLKDIANAYEKEIEKIDLAGDLAQKITMLNVDNDVRFLEGYSIAELPVPKEFVGNSIKKLRIRNRYGVDILSIKSVGRGGSTVRAIPRAYYTFNKDDAIIVAGKTERIAHLKHLD